MKTSNLLRAAFLCSLAISLLTPLCHAEIYKWVDAKGQTHYSERNDAAGSAKAVELKQAPPSAAAQTAERPLDYWQEQDRQFKVRQLQGSVNKTADKAVAPTPPKSLSGGRTDGSDLSRCNLARDVLNGAVKHRNDAPTDTYDRQVAENDVRAFCH